MTQAPSGTALAADAGTWDVDLPTGVLYGDAALAGIHGLDPAAAAAGLPQEAVLRSIWSPTSVCPEC